jgi:folate-binding protein YgfZ
MRVSPLRNLHQQAEASLVTYGDAAADVRLVETFGELELEYAALRKHSILVDQPHRAVIEASGSDRLDFLNRMVTQELKGLSPYQVRKSFWLNRKGRIDADLRIIELPGRTLLDMDVHALNRTMDGLSAFIITEDVVLKDASETLHRLALHGPTSVALLQAVSKPIEDGPPLADLRRGQATTISIAGATVVVDRDDSVGEVGLELTLPADAALPAYTQLIEAGQEHDGNGSGGADSVAARIRLRPAGWHAFNIARIEAGTPLFNIDFGPTSLPHETGIIRERVSFTKGCYLGQEVVARMESRGHSKGRIVALRFRDTRSPDGHTRLPIAGAHVWSAAAPDADPVGSITSSTLSPMLGAEPIAFAMVKHDFLAPGTELLVLADDQRIPATVQQDLAFWKRG